MFILFKSSYSNKHNIGQSLKKGLWHQTLLQLQLLLYLRLGISLQVWCWATFPIPQKRVNLGKGSSLGAFFNGLGWRWWNWNYCYFLYFYFFGSGVGRNKFSPVCRVSRVSGGGGWGILNLFSVWYRVGFLEFGTLVYRLSRGLKRCFLFYFSIKSELASTMQWRFYLTPVEESRRKKNLRNQGSGLPYKGYRSSGQCLIMHFFPVLHISVRVVDHAMPSAGLSETTKPWKKYSKP